MGNTTYCEVACLDEAAGLLRTGYLQPDSDENETDAFQSEDRAMAESQSRWWLTIIVGPLVVGAIVALVTFFIPKLFTSGKKLSYSVDGPIMVLDRKILPNTKIIVNDVGVSSLFVYKVQILNSGDMALKNLPIRFVFNTENTDFNILSVNHETKPPHEFGKITEEGSEKTSKRFIYELINPGDTDIITFIANDSPPLGVFAKLEDLKLIVTESQDTVQTARTWDIWAAILTAAAVVIGALSSTISSLWRTLAEKRTSNVR